MTAGQVKEGEIMRVSTLVLDKLHKQNSVYSEPILIYAVYMLYICCIYNMMFVVC